MPTNTKKIIRTALRKVVAVFGLLTLFAGGEAGAQTADEFFMLANNAYRAGDFQRAKENYESAAAMRSPSAEMYYNLANTEAKLGNKGKALLCYLRAIAENPRMPEARANLEMFAKDNSLSLPHKSGIDQVLSELSQTEWAATGFLAFWAAILLLLIPPMYKKSGMATVFLAILSGALFVISAAGVVYWLNFSQIAVAVENDVALRLSPTDTAPVVSIVSEGEIGRVQDMRKNFVKVAAENGKTGWVSADKFVPVEL